MRPIIYRGQTVDTGRWIEGHPVVLYNHIYMHYVLMDAVLSKMEVRPDTICACTGQSGEGNELIFENDIVFDTFDDEFGVVEWDEYDSKFIVRYQGCIETFAIIDSADLRIVGNIFDDPDLVPWYTNKEAIK